MVQGVLQVARMRITRGYDLLSWIHSLGDWRLIHCLHEAISSVSTN